MSVDRLIRSVGATLDTLDASDLADLCPRVAVVDATRAASVLGIEVDRRHRPLVPSGERVLVRGSALVRVHAALDADDGRPLRLGLGARARLLPVAAGAGPVAVTDRRVIGVLRPSAHRAALVYAMAWAEIDDVSPASSGGVLLASTVLLGALTLDLL